MKVSAKPIPQAFDRLPKKYIEELRQEPGRFDTLDDVYKNNRNLVIDLIGRNINIAPWLPSSITEDRAVMTQIFQQFPEMGGNKKFMRIALKTDLAFIAHANPQILKREGYLREILISHPEVVDLLPASIKNDQRFSIIHAQAKASGNKVSPPVVRKTSLRKSIKLENSPINPENFDTSEQI
jgi:hypothetical protein